jgi:hypothetical protein
MRYVRDGLVGLCVAFALFALLAWSYRSGRRRAPQRRTRSGAVRRQTRRPVRGRRPRPVPSGDAKGGHWYRRKRGRAHRHGCGTSSPLPSGATVCASIAGRTVGDVGGNLRLRWCLTWGCSRQVPFGAQANSRTSGPGRPGTAQPLVVSPAVPPVFGRRLDRRRRHGHVWGHPVAVGR